MKRFTCREIMNNEGGCDTVFEGETAMDVATKCSMHVMASQDAAHKPLLDMMAKPKSEEEKKAWFDWFNSQWEKKESA